MLDAPNYEYSWFSILLERHATPNKDGVSALGSSKAAIKIIVPRDDKSRNQFYPVSPFVLLLLAEAGRL